MIDIILTIPGDPIAKKRPRFARRGKFVTTYNCQETEEGKFMTIVAAQLAGKEPIPAEQAIKLTCRFHMPIPAGWSKKKRLMNASIGIRHVKRPDLDNLIKFVKDCLNGVAYHDDSQVVFLTAGKKYSDNPHTEIIIQEA